MMQFNEILDEKVTGQQKILTYDVNNISMTRQEETRAVRHASVMQHGSLTYGLYRDSPSRSAWNCINRLLLVMPPPTFRCCATESELEVELLATLFNSDIDEDFSRSREAERSRSSEADRMRPTGVPAFKSMESINSFTCHNKTRIGDDVRDVLDIQF